MAPENDSKLSSEMTYICSWYILKCNVKNKVNIAIEGCHYL